ncbi:hypothetical protein PG996_007217 [Apiospora saccharicola]|uniref:Proteophosphoglycan ppg4 n=1 Tax=Apiospora saccharicola TaxID=335842 RepID=A0ABR1VCY8_9PEZI
MPLGKEALPIRSKQHASHSNTARHRARLGKSQNKEFRRRGVFPFFDLPYELRHEILKLAILQETTPTATTHSRPSPSSSSSTTKKSYQQALVLFLTCRWLYEEAAAIFYQEVVLDTRASSDSGSSSSPTPFLVRSLTPRLYVRTLRIRFYVKEYHLGLFHTVYAPILRDMAQHGQLEHLVLELGYQFPSPSFWGGGARSGEEPDDADPFHDDVPIVPGRHRKDRELYAPLFVTQAPFQGFLKMLHGFSLSSSSSSPATMKKMTLYLEAADHPPFWCAFHRAHPSGEACGGSWPDDNTQLLKLRWRDLVKTFAGAQAPTDSWGIDAI